MFDANPDAASSHTPVEPGIKSLQSKLDDIKRSKKGTKHKDGRPLRPLSACKIGLLLVHITCAIPILTML
jgi:sorbitol-specific phosphotransferase system component IIBC